MLKMGDEKRLPKICLILLSILWLFGFPHLKLSGIRYNKSVKKY